MESASYVLLISVAAAALVLTFWPFARAWHQARGQRPVTCPETKQPAAVEIDPMGAAFNALLGVPETSLRSCTRWPKRAACDQACLAQIQIEKSPAS